jgi:DNA-binding beta-propeller fold protein YncE
VATVAVGTCPKGIAVNPQTGDAWIANTGNNNGSPTTVVELTHTPGAAWSTDWNIPTTINLAAGTAPLAVAIDPAYGTNPERVFVGDGNLAKVYVISGGTVTPVPTGAPPEDVAVNPLTHYAYTANNTGNDITVISPSYGTNTITTSPTGLQPWAIAIDPNFNSANGGTVYIADEASANVAFMPENNLSLNGLTLVAAGAAPQSIAVDTQAQVVYTANVNGGSYSWFPEMIPPPAPTATTVLSGTHPAAVAVDPLMGTAYVVNRTSNTLTIVGGNSPVTNSYPGPVASNATSIEVNPYTGTAYAAFGGPVVTVNGTPEWADFVLAVNGVANTNQTYTTCRWKIGATLYPCYTNSLAVNPMTGYVYVSNEQSSATAVAISPGSNPTIIVMQDSNATTLWAIAVNPNTNMVYVANINSNNVSVFNGASNSYSYTIPLTASDKNPIGIAVDPVLNYVLVSNKGSGTLDIIDSAGGVHSVALGGTPDDGHQIMTVDTVNHYVYVPLTNGDVVGVYESTWLVAGTVLVGSTSNYPRPVVLDLVNDTLYTGVHGSTASAFGEVCGYGSTACATGPWSVYESILLSPPSVAPEGIAFDPGTGEVALANSTVTTIDFFDSLSAYDLPLGSATAGGLMEMIVTDPVTAISYADWDSSGNPSGLTVFKP